ncbi:CRISPR-associated helicase Cas3', partial [Stieleria sp. TO1_6]|uniref:CRISPR-associated helicase Cas3' n=1 Tax=Stieleria tagensis TaxID=2956795 RepID=UPI00209B63B8
MNYYAHSLPDQPPSNWETMAEHEKAVANRCEEFAARIHPEFKSWGNLLGCWHDIGKYSNEFQTYIHKANHQLDAMQDIHRAELSGRVDHSTAAAKWAVDQFGPLGRLVAYVFAGHHAGLPDWDDGHSQSGLRQRLNKQIANFANNAPEDLKFLPKPPMVNLAKLGKHPISPGDHIRQTFRVAMFARMLFSCLVDADFLATEAFMSPIQSKQREFENLSLDQLRDCLAVHIDELTAAAPKTILNEIRKKIREECIEKSTLEPGFFSLDVPTGGGKTLASLEFALRHAHAGSWEMDRVIIAVPFTSIIEQNAQVYRDVFASFGDRAVLEHHSNLEPCRESAANRLQSENWDAPLVVTTNVQLFESLFATRTSQCRKLHRLARSVIILDEAQTLPVELIQPTLMVLEELVECYGCSVVLCTATQPALSIRDRFPIGLRNIRAIIDDADVLHQKLARTRVNVIGGSASHLTNPIAESSSDGCIRLDNEDLADEMAALDRVLCIVNTRPDAADVFDRLGDDEGNFHLSTRMCAAHRLERFTEIRKCLQPESKRPCRVVSTQLIEAGVDVDFPVVMRAACGLDSLTQAAGRCNREGKLEVGEVVLFQTERLPPPGYLRQTAQLTWEPGQSHVD